MKFLAKIGFRLLQFIGIHRVYYHVLELSVDEKNETYIVTELSRGNFIDCVTSLLKASQKKSSDYLLVVDMYRDKEGRYATLWRCSDGESFRGKISKAEGQLWFVADDFDIPVDSALGGIFL